MKLLKLAFLLVLSNPTYGLAASGSSAIKGPFKGNWYSVHTEISTVDFQKIAREYTHLVLSEAQNLLDSSFPENNQIKSLHLNGQKKLTNAVLTKLSKVEFLKLEDCPQITATGLMLMKSLKSIYLWNMNHIKDQEIAALREKGVKVVDGRFKKSKNY